MEKTNWIGKSGGNVSDPANWDNGVPDHRTKVLIDVNERTEIIWDLKNLGIPVEMLCDPEHVVIYISGDCLEGGSYFVPDAIRDHFEAFKDESLDLDELDRPPPGYGMFCANRNWDGGGGDNNASTAANWSGDTAPVTGDNVTFGSFPPNGTKPCNWNFGSRVDPNNFTVNSAYTGTITLTVNLTVTGSFTLNGGTFDVNGQTLTIPNLDLDSATLLGDGLINCSGNWDNSTGTFTCETGTVDIKGSAALTISTAGQAFYNLTISNTGSVNITLNGDLDVNGAFDCSSSR